MSRIELNPVAVFVWLMLRGIYLWAVLPIAAVCGFCAHRYLTRHDASVGQIVGWLDMNIMAAIFHTVFRPLRNSVQVPWIPIRSLPFIGKEPPDKLGRAQSTDA